MGRKGRDPLATHLLGSNTGQKEVKPTLSNPWANQSNVESGANAGQKEVKRVKKRSKRTSARTERADPPPGGVTHTSRLSDTYSVLEHLCVRGRLGYKNLLSLSLSHTHTYRRTPADCLTRTASSSTCV